jgi:hypothetical protein
MIYSGPVRESLQRHGPLIVKLKDPKGGDPSEWPEDLRIREEL